MAISTTKKHELVDLQLHCNDDGDGYKQYYLTAKYQFKQGPHTYERTFPHIYLHIYPTPEIYIDHDHLVERAEINMGFGRLPLSDPFTDPDNTFFIDKIIHTDTRKMTLEEVEKQLGYKVELVSEHKKED